jgi:DNA-binding GntR family transcriptional regulator
MTACYRICSIKSYEFRMLSKKTDQQRRPTSRLNKTESLLDTIYGDIRRRLNLGEWRPGDRLLDYEIAEDFDCTRMPVRQALLRLVNDGLLNTTTRGFQVPVLSDAEIREIFEVRRVLEPAAAAMVVAVADPDQLRASLTKAVDIAKVALTHHDTALMVSANTAFRRAWLQCVRNERLLQMIAMSADHANQVRFSNTQDIENYENTISELEKLAGALTSGESSRAQTAMFNFLLAAESAYFSRVQRI